MKRRAFLSIWVGTRKPDSTSPPLNIRFYQKQSQTGTFNFACVRRSEKFIKDTIMFRLGNQCQYRQL